MPVQPIFVVFLPSCFNLRINRIILDSNTINFCVRFFFFGPTRRSMYSPIKLEILDWCSRNLPSQVSGLLSCRSFFVSSSRQGSALSFATHVITSAWCWRRSMLGSSSSDEEHSLGSGMHHLMLKFSGMLHLAILLRSVLLSWKHLKSTLFLGFCQSAHDIYYFYSTQSCAHILVPCIFVSSLYRRLDMQRIHCVF